MFTFLRKTLSLISSANRCPRISVKRKPRIVRPVGQNLSYELTTRNHELEIVFSRLNLLAILNGALGRKTAIREPVPL